MKKSLVVLALTLSAFAFLGACTEEDSTLEPTEPPTETSTDAASPSATTTAADQTGTPTVDPEECGEEVLPQGATTLDVAGRECLQAAFDAGRPAVFSTTRPTVEGDPVTTRVTVIGAGQVRVEVDATQDRFSAPADRVVRTYECTTMAPDTSDEAGRLTITGCSDDATFSI